MTWQPIETGPKDTTDVLLFSPKDGVNIGWWHTSEKMWATRAIGIVIETIEPTHWMPLPEPPDRSAAT